MPDAEASAPALSSLPKTVSRRELFLGFLKIGLLGFGGIAAWARHVIVEERGWLSEREYAAILAIGQVLPGPNTVNAAVMIGDRFQGIAGAVIAVLALMAMPLAILVALAAVYERFAAVPDVAAGIGGTAAAAAGLVIGTALKMAHRLKLRRTALGFGLAAFATVGILGWPLVPVVLALAPLSIAAAYAERRP